MKSKRFLILGAGGQLGTEWTTFFKRHNYIHHATYYPETDITNNVHIESKFREFNPDIVINCAAYTAVDKAEYDITLNSTINHLAVKSLAYLCYKYNSLLVHYSTDYIFAGTLQDKTIYPDGYPEDAPPLPVNAYGFEKWNGEQAIKLSGTRYLILRISWLCSSYGNNFLKTIMRLAKEREQLNVVNDQIGSPTFTFDVVDATLRLIERNLEGEWHITTQDIITWYDFASLIVKTAHIDVNLTPITTSELATKAKRPLFSKLCTNKFEKYANGNTYFTIDGIRRVIAELKYHE